MPVLSAPETFTHELPHARFWSLATPRRGSSETSVWRVQLNATMATSPHSLTREEIFVVLSGNVRLSIAGVVSDAKPGDAIVVPKDTEVILSCTSAQAELICCLPVGGQARMGGQLFTPPWAE